MSESVVPPPSPTALSVDILNFRDLGGYATRYGAVVRSGAVFRSTDLGRIRDEAVQALGQLGLGTVADLRTASEREALPDRVPPGVKELPLDVFADRGVGDLAAQLGSLAAHMQDLLTDASFAKRVLGDGRGAEYLRRSYHDLVTLPSAHTSYRTLMRTLIDDDRPLLFHCTTGKDRTGWAAAIVLFTLGADEDTVFEDYLRTNDMLLPALEPLFEPIVKQGVDRADLEAVLGVRREYLQTALDTMRDVYGSFDRYLSEVLLVTDAERESLRERLLD
ncbi:tyrosine-protein phosphatase [Rhodococcus sp. Z13]|uniref:Tyrosine-protein phosphatase n=1 Tax=Rhodococcus sacchari TaxID=2962047 RepID=A0ACD4DIK2_9NOCA|nr:tyrosine-protein phosphatase [Rhodococcus sp. Z13]UYP19866.1 tyrosine-protein phosphatase [Rhodococcus sp. Z13]